MLCNLPHLCWMLTPQISEIFKWTTEYVPGPAQKALYSCDFVRSFIRQEIKSRRERGTTDGPEDFIDFYLDQIEKVSNLCCMWRRSYHNGFPAPLLHLSIHSKRYYRALQIQLKNSAVKLKHELWTVSLITCFRRIN